MSEHLLSSRLSEEEEDVESESYGRSPGIYERIRRTIPEKALNSNWMIAAGMTSVSVLIAILLVALLSSFFRQPSVVQQGDSSVSSAETQLPSQPPRNIVFMISDGLGPASVSFARTFYQHLHHLPYDHQLPLDTIHVGQSRTRSSSSLVTDSAAGATAFSCALKTHNQFVGVDPLGDPCGTLLESAKHQQNMLTGLVATSRITHATPASFSAHVRDRNDENAIAIQQLGDNPLGRSVDLMFGGGYCHFLPKSDGGCRHDNRNLFEEAREKHGWNQVYWGDREGFDKLTADPEQLPVMSLFSNDHMAFEIDRNATLEPSLKEMSSKALDLLHQAATKSDTGFFLMIEGSRIDMAAHSNDAATHVHDIFAYQDTVELVKKFVDEHPDTLLISTSDHETGGLTLARQVSAAYPEYLWYPDVLSKVKRSSGQLAEDIVHRKDLDDASLREVLNDALGVHDATEAELHSIRSHSSVKRLNYYLSDMVSLRAQLGWTTHGHSGVDVNLYAYGRGVERLMGNHENTELGVIVADYLSLNLTDMTSQLNHGNPTFHVTEKEKVDYNDKLEHYHHIGRNLDHHGPLR